MTDTLQNDTNGASVTDADSPKVVISFKTAPINKIRLSQSATQRGLTLSEFVESIVGSFARNASQNESLDAALGKLAYYENDILMNLYEQFKGQNVKFKSANGRNMEVKIEAPEDVYTVIINSFQISKK